MSVSQPVHLRQRSGNSKDLPILRKDMLPKKLEESKRMILGFALASLVLF